MFQAFAEQNVEVLNDAGVTKIVANCPHCFNTLANEYPDFGGGYEVIHHSELLSQLVRDGRLKPERSEGLSVTYHDSCYLARHNDVLASPRELVAAVGQPVEMARSGKSTFCCGAGGAHMWMEERAKPINVERVREAAGTGADTLAVACPFCTVMLDDGVQSEGGRDARRRRRDAAGGGDRGRPAGASVNRPSMRASHSSVLAPFLATMSRRLVAAGVSFEVQGAAGARAGRSSPALPTARISSGRPIPPRCALGGSRRSPASDRCASHRTRV